MQTYFDESVLAFILEWKSGKFQLTKEGNTLVTLYLVLWHFRCPTPKYGCGVLFIWSKAFQSLHSDKLISLTLSFYTNCTFEVGEQNVLDMGKVKKCKLCGCELEGTAKSLCDNCEKDVEAGLLESPDKEKMQKTTDAESYVAGIAKILLVLGVILSLISGLTLCSLDMIGYGILVIVFGIMSSMFTWAILKIFVDISITLKVINSKIHK